MPKEPGATAVASGAHAHVSRARTRAFYLMIAVTVLSLLGATRPPGWRVPAWSAGGAAILFGIASATLPHMPSSVGHVWGALLATWGLAFVLVTEARHRGMWVRAPRIA